MAQLLKEQLLIGSEGRQIQRIREVTSLNISICFKSVSVVVLESAKREKENRRRARIAVLTPLSFRTDVRNLFGNNRIVLSKLDLSR